MTISSTANRISYTGNGATTAFSFPYYFQDQADLVVLLTTIADGTQTTEVLNSDYTISGTTDANGFYPDGGTINFVTAPASTQSITIYRDPAATQTTEYVDNDPLPAADLQGPMDKLTTIVQRVKDLISRSLTQPDGDTAAIGRLPGQVNRANGGSGSYMAFDANGDPTTLAIPASGSSVPVSVAMAPVVEAASLSAARTAMGAMGLADANAMTGSINEASATLASAATVNIGAAAANYLIITGTTTITAFDTVQAGTRRKLKFSGALTLTHNAAKLILPGAANITTAAGDYAEFESEGSGNWRCTSYMPASGTILATALTALLASNAQALGGSDTTHALTSAGLASAQNVSATGHMKLPGGLIINWGSVTIASGVSTNATFDLAFPNAVFAVVFTPNQNQVPSVSAVNNSAATVTYGSTVTSLTTYFVAIGH